MPITHYQLVTRLSHPDPDNWEAVQKEWKDLDESELIEKLRLEPLIVNFDDKDPDPASFKTYALFLHHSGLVTCRELGE